jgi:hypothetical protein
MNYTEMLLNQYGKLVAFPLIFIMFGGCAFWGIMGSEIIWQHNYLIPIIIISSGLVLSAIACIVCVTRPDPNIDRKEPPS